MLTIAYLGPEKTNTHFAALKAVRGSTHAVVGAYHSHPRTPAVPSETDLAEAAYADYLHLIVSLAEPADGGAVRAFRIDRGNFGAVELVPVE